MIRACPANRRGRKHLLRGQTLGPFHTRENLDMDQHSLKSCLHKIPRMQLEKKVSHSPDRGRDCNTRVLSLCVIRDRLVLNVIVPSPARFVCINATAEPRKFMLFSKPHNNTTCSAVNQPHLRYLVSFLYDVFLIDAYGVDPKLRISLD